MWGDYIRCLRSSFSNNYSCDWCDSCKYFRFKYQCWCWVTRASTDNVNLMKNVPTFGSSFEFMGGNKVVLETTDTFTVVSDVNNSLMLL